MEDTLGNTIVLSEGGSEEMSQCCLPKCGVKLQLLSHFNGETQGQIEFVRTWLGLCQWVPTMP